MSSRNDVIYVRLDVRGAKGQSKQALYRHLGGVEVQDQITVLRSVTIQLIYPRQFNFAVKTDSPFLFTFLSFNSNLYYQTIDYIITRSLFYILIRHLRNLHFNVLHSSF